MPSLHLSAAKVWSGFQLPPLLYVAAESDLVKLQALARRTMWPEVSHLYRDVRDLPEQTWDFKQECNTKVSSVDLLLMGFPCKDLSCLKQCPKAFNAESQSVSFNAFHALDKILPEWNPACVLLENVKGAECCPARCNPMCRIASGV